MVAQTRARARDDARGGGGIFACGVPFEFFFARATGRRSMTPVKNDGIEFAIDEARERFPRAKSFPLEIHRGCPTVVNLKMLLINFNKMKKKREKITMNLIPACNRDV